MDGLDWIGLDGIWVGWCFEHLMVLMSIKNINWKSRKCCSKTRTKAKGWCTKKTCITICNRQNIIICKSYTYIIKISLQGEAPGSITSPFELEANKWCKFGQKDLPPTSTLSQQTTFTICYISYEVRLNILDEIQQS